MNHERYARDVLPFSSQQLTHYCILRNSQTGLHQKDGPSEYANTTPRMELYATPGRMGYEPYSGDGSRVMVTAYFACVWALYVDVVCWVVVFCCLPCCRGSRIGSERAELPERGLAV